MIQWAEENSVIRVGFTDILKSKMGGRRGKFMSWELWCGNEKKTLVFLSLSEDISSVHKDIVAPQSQDFCVCQSV